MPLLLWSHADICGQFDGGKSERGQHECISCFEDTASPQTAESSCSLGRNEGR